MKVYSYGNPNCREQKIVFDGNTFIHYYNCNVLCEIPKYDISRNNYQLRFISFLPNTKAIGDAHGNFPNINY